MLQDKSIKVYVPTRDKNNLPLDDSKINYWQSHIIEIFTDLFGGCTKHNNSKGYYAFEGKMIKEHVTIIEGLCNANKYNIDIDQMLYKLSYDMKKELNQDSILFTIENIRIECI